MSVGNLKTQGQKGTNWTWQYKMLLGLDKIAASVATNGKEYEAELVSITCLAPTPPATTPPAGTVIRLEVRVWDPTSGAFTNISYYEPGSTTADPYDYTACTKTYLESGDATEATLAAILLKNGEIETTANAILAMNTDIEAKTTLVVANTDQIKADTQDILTKTTANETNTAGILADTAVIETNTTAILADTAAIDTATAAINTSTSKANNVAAMIRLTGTGTTTISELVKSISIYNAHASATATVNIGSAGDVNLLAGETVNFDAGGNANTFADDYFVISSGDAAGDVLVIYTY